MTDDRKSWLRTVVLSITIGFLSGVGAVHMTVAGDVREHGILIGRQQKDFEEEKQRTDARVFELASMFKESNALVKASIEHTSRLVTTIEAQNKLIVDQNTLINKLRLGRP